MYNYSDSGTPAISITFFILVVLIGTLCAMNLLIATIVEAFQEAHASDKKEEMEEKADNEILKQLLSNDTLVKALQSPRNES